MLEFDSISVSSYEADSLAPQLTDKSKAGWDVVAIVSAGSSVTAFLSRTAVEGESDSTDEPVAEVAAATDLFAVADEPADEPVGAVEVPAIDEPVVDTPAVEEPAPQPSLADDIAVLASQIESEEAAAPTDEAGGWAATTTAEPTLPGSAPTEPIVTEPVIAEPEPEPVIAEPEPVVAEPEPAVAEPVQQAAAAAAPAGWYADPSGRYELRYWDGSQWTEHVSRAGQQFTDPPVA